MSYGHGYGFGKFLLLLGVVFFLVWAFRTLDKKQLKKWMIGLLVAGLLVSVGSHLWRFKRVDKNVNWQERVEAVCTGHEALETEADWKGHLFNGMKTRKMVK